MMLISFGSSILLLPQFWQQLMMAILGIVLVVFIWRIPVRDMGDGHKLD
jgi:energy-coupling factor transporter transmembrane protein EcfT